MVTFVCSNCNSSLKKSQVPIHRCNGTFACITCNCDFNKTSFKTHDRCITEAEKYQGSDFKPKVNKGEAKQESWSNSVIEALDNYKPIDGRLNSIINQLRSRSNIPQKENKFRNFLAGIPGSKQVSNCHEIIWGVISKHRDNLKTSMKIVSVCENDNTESQPATNGDILKIANGETSNTDIKSSPKKTKKRKNDEVAADEGIEPKIKKIKETEKTSEKLVEMEKIMDVSTEKKKKKKKSEAMVVEEPITEAPKKKKKKLNDEALQNEITIEDKKICKPTETEELMTEGSKKTKKKKKSKNKEIPEEIVVSEKKKKKETNKLKPE